MASPSMNAPNGRPIVWQTEIEELPLKSRGKVRDLYDAGDKLLLIATDRLSAFDVVLPTPIPDKGRVLTQLSLFWFDKLRDVIPNHVISATEFPAEVARSRCRCSKAAPCFAARRSRFPWNAWCADISSDRAGRIIKKQALCAASRCLQD